MTPTTNLLVTLRGFYEAYAACLDDQDFDRWPDFFTDTAIYRVQSFENHARGLPHAAIYCEGRGMLLDRVSATGVLVYEERRQRRMIFNLLVKSDVGDVIHSQASFTLIEHMLDRDPVLALTGRYIDTIERRGTGEFRIQDRLCVYDNHRIVQNLIFPV